MRKASGKTLFARVRGTALYASIYFIYKARNCLIFQQKQLNPKDIFRQMRKVIMLKYMVNFSIDGGYESDLRMRWFK